MSLAITQRTDARTSAQAWLVWSLAVAFVVYYFGIQTGYSIVNPSLQRDLGITPTEVGVVAATYTWVYAFGQLFSGSLLDRLGARKVLLPAIALVCAGAFVFGTARGFGALVLSQVVLALGACAGFVGAGYVGGSWFGPARFSFMFGLVQFVASFASAFSQNAIALALDHLSWQSLTLWSGAIGLVLFALACAFLRDPAPLPAPQTRGARAFVADILQRLLAVARIGHIWLVAIVGALVFGCMLSMGVVWAPKLLAIQGVDPSRTTMAASLIWLGLAAGCFFVPRWSDAIASRKLPIIAGIVVQLVALFAMFRLEQPGAVVMMALSFVFGAGAAVHMLSFSSAADVVEPTRIGTAAALVNGVMFLVGGVLISRPGVRVDDALHLGLTRGSLELAIHGGQPLLASLAIALVLSLALRETYPKR